MKNFIKPIYHFWSYYMPIIPKIIETIYFWLSNLFVNQNLYKNNLEKGREILEEILADSKYYYVFINQGIGDTVMVALYSYIFEKKYKKPIAFVVPRGHIDVLKRFDYVKKVSGLTKEEFNNLILYISKQGFYETNKFCYAFFKMNISKSGIRNWSSTKWNKRLILSKRYKENVFNIDLETSMYNVKNEKVNISLLKKYNINSKSIIINPYANTVTALKLSFWEQLVEQLISKGYNVFTNIGNPQTENAVKGSKPLNLSLDEIYLISPKLKSFIALRSGICEYLALNNTKMIVLNKNKKNYEKYDDVNEFSTKKTINNIYITNRKYDNIILEIMNILDKE